MKKKYNLILIIISLFIFSTNVLAATGSITAYSSTRTAVVGSTFSVTVKVSSNEALGSWQFGISYDSSYISLQSGETNIAAYGDGNMRSKTYTYRFKAIKSGKAAVRINSPSMVSWNNVNELFTPKTSNAYINVKTRAQIEASYSKDNNLKSLTVEGFELTPAFNKNITEYSVQVPDDMLNIKVNALVNDRTAVVRGIGSIDVSEGNNKVEVVVTAQNGSTKKYIINVEVKDLNPIMVNVKGINYNVVKKESLLTCPTGYTPTKIKINELEIPAFTSELTKFTLVGLKDEKGEVGLFIYDEAKQNYTKYIELKSNILTVYPLKIKDKIKNFLSAEIDINGTIYDGLKNLTTGTMLIYGMNVETGEKNYYQYDKAENTFLKYDFKANDTIYKENEEYKMLLIILGMATLILIIIVIILLSKTKKLKTLALKITTKEDN